MTIQVSQHQPIGCPDSEVIEQNAAASVSRRPATSSRSSPPSAIGMGCFLLQVPMIWLLFG